MAFPSSYVSARTLKDILTGALNVDLGSDTIKVALFTNSVTGADENAVEAYGSGTWGSNEASGAGYTAGGKTVSASVNNPTDGVVKLTADSSTLDWTNSSFTARGALIYNSSRSNRVLAAINFGNDETVVMGDFSITWDTDDVILEY